MIKKYVEKPPIKLYAVFDYSTQGITGNGLLGIFSEIPQEIKMKIEKEWYTVKEVTINEFKRNGI